MCTSMLYVFYVLCLFSMYRIMMPSLSLICLLFVSRIFAVTVSDFTSFVLFVLFLTRLRDAAVIILVRFNSLSISSYFSPRSWWSNASLIFCGWWCQRLFISFSFLFPLRFTYLPSQTFAVLFLSFFLLLHIEFVRLFAVSYLSFFCQWHQVPRLEKE